MTYSPDYATFVQSRLKDGGDILKTVTPAQANLLHLALGIAGECGEFILGAMSRDKANCKEEAGDNLFFIQALETATGVGSYGHSVEVYGLDEALLLMSVWSGEIVDVIKKHVIYNKPLPPAALYNALGSYKGSLHEACNILGISFASARADNIEKLTKRYASGYSDKAAQERKDKVCN